jgi:nucleoside-diphosphate-sugar epimerase
VRLLTTSGITATTWRRSTWRGPPAGQGVPFSKADLTDYGQAIAAFSAVDDRFAKVKGIVHLAAIPAPGLAPKNVILQNNVLSTYNVFEAARVLGIRNVV